MFVACDHRRHHNCDQQWGGFQSVGCMQMGQNLSFKFFCSVSHSHLSCSPSFSLHPTPFQQLLFSGLFLSHINGLSQFSTSICILEISPIENHRLRFEKVSGHVRA